MRLFLPLVCAASALVPWTAYAQINSIDGLRLWLDATDGSTISTSGGKVVQWDDKSGWGNNAIQTNVDRQPVYTPSAINGSAAIHFDASGAGGGFTSQPTDDGMLIRPGTSEADPTAFKLNRNYTIFLVDQYAGGVGGRTLTNVDASSNWLLGHWGGNEAHYTGAFVGNNIGVGSGKALISEAIGTGTSNYYSRNNRGAGYNLGALAQPGRIGIGETDITTWNEPSTADVGAVVAFNRALTDTERWAVQDYLAASFNQPATISRAHATYSTVFTGGDSGEGLDFQGNFVAAVNVGGPGGFTIGNATFTSDTGVTAENVIPGWYPANFGGATPTGNDSNLNTVMQSIRWSAADGVGVDDVTVSINGLTPGNTYKLQMLFAENLPNWTRHFAVQVEGKTINADYAEAAFRGSDNPNALGNALVHQFVAKDGTLNFTLSKGTLTNGDLNAILNGFTVEDRGVTGITTTGTFNSAAQLDFSGNFVYAVNAGGTGGQIVGNAAFTSETTPGVNLGAENSINGWAAGANFGASSDDTNLSSAMGSIRWNETNAEKDGLSLDLNVTAGRTYKLQLMFMESCCDRGFDVAFEGVRTIDDFSLAGLGATVANSRGAVITHTFTAQDGVFSVMLDGFATGFADRNPILNAFTLEDITVVPEPASLTLAAAAGLMTLRRRRRQA